MKRILYLVLMATITSCGTSTQQNSTQNSDSTENSQTVQNEQVEQTEQTKPCDIDMTIDWDKPLYELDLETKDTIRKWVYKGDTVIEYSKGDFGEGESTSKYDEKNRIISQGGYINTGNNHNFEMEYVYKGKVRHGKGSQITEGYSEFTETEEIKYFIDDECKLDTLTETYTAEVSWDQENVPQEKELESYCVSKIENGKVIERTYYGKESYESKKIVFRSRILYEYNSCGLYSKTMIVNENNQPLFEYATTTYTYKGNTCETNDTGSGSITYYGKK